MNKIEIKKKQGSIVEALRDAILSGSIPADTEMTQNELAQSLGVSRMPVREALIILEYQGLIRRLPNNHVRVVPQTREYYTEIFRTSRYLLVPLLCHAQYPEKMSERDPEFHRELYQQCEFAFQRKILESLTEIYIVYASTYLMSGCIDSAAYIRDIKDAAASKDERELWCALERYDTVLIDRMMKGMER